MSVTIDVVDLRRIERLREDYGDALERRLLHPAEREDRAGIDRRLAAALAVKEAWIKSRRERPAGWTFDCSALVPALDVPDRVRGVVHRFADDLEATSIEACTLNGSWAWHGVHDRWLIAAVLA